MESIEYRSILKEITYQKAPDLITMEKKRSFFLLKNKKVGICIVYTIIIYKFIVSLNVIELC